MESCDKSDVLSSFFFNKNIERTFELHKTLPRLMYLYNIKLLIHKSFL
jgi:hypothetical protein